MCVCMCVCMVYVCVCVCRRSRGLREVHEGSVWGITYMRLHEGLEPVTYISKIAYHYFPEPCDSTDNVTVEKFDTS